MKRIIIPFIAAATLTSCGNSGRVNEKAYLRAASLDGDRMTFVFYSEDDDTVTVTADSPENARSAAELAVGKEIFTGHTELIILGSCDSAEVLEFMLHKWRLSPSCMVVTGEHNGEKLLTEHDVEDLTGALKCAQKQGKAPPCDIIRVLSEELRNDTGT